MEMRELKALELAARAKIVQADDGTWTVPSQGGNGGSYRVVTWPGAESCTCEDYQLRREPCRQSIAGTARRPFETLTHPRQTASAAALRRPGHEAGR